jgi:2-polyprenyl-6-methoxyphenol hydroxylase-like FAD-dependent oxidoreductase
VVVIDETSATSLARLGVALPGTPLREMIVHLPNNGRRYFPNRGSWQIGVNALFGGRRLARLSTLAALECALLEAYLRAGGAIRHGTEARLSDGGEGGVTVGFSEVDSIEAQLVVIAEGAGGEATRGRAKRIAVADSPSRFLCLDFLRWSSPIIQSGDLVSRFSANRGALIYGFAADSGFSLNMLLPNRPNRFTRRDHFHELQSMLKGLAIRGTPEPERGTYYESGIVMADRIEVASNAILIGDALREADAISGAGVNAAIADGVTIGSYFKKRSGEEQRAPTEGVLRKLAANTHYAMELSLFIREMAAFLFHNPDTSRSGFEMGLSARGGKANIMDYGKSLFADWTSLVLGDRMQSRMIVSSFQALGGPEPLFQSSARQRQIGTVHPSTTYAW